ncbi:MAG: hypothetical protein HYR91_06570, partial [Flavobacteriia bacterium]|nr:hypothetical protein [Flavobacteriia bacterium]
KTEAHGTLDNNGEAVVELRQKNRTYSVRVVEPANTCYNKQITQYFDSKYDVNGVFTFEFAECAYFKLDINNVNCSGPTDNFKLYYMGRQVADQGSNIVGALSLEGDGCFNYVGDSFSSVPIGKMMWKWVVTRNGNTTTFFDTINFLPEEYKVYHINY